MKAIYKKELRAYFHSIIGWLFLAFFLAFVGLYFYLYNLYSGYTHFGYALSSITLIFLLLVPMVTMRIMAEENRQKTDQLLFTAPVSVERILAGKYLAVVTLFGIVMLVTCTYPLLLTFFGEVNLPMAYGSIFGFFLLGCSYLAIGTFLSTVTDSQAFAAVLTFIVVLVTVLMDSIAGLFSGDAKTAWLVFAFLLLLLAVVTWLSMKNRIVTGGFFLISQAMLAGCYLWKPSMLEGAIPKVFAWFSVVDRFDDFVTGVFNLSSVVYYLSVMVLFYFLSVQEIKKRRWN